MGLRGVFRLRLLRSRVWEAGCGAIRLRRVEAGRICGGWELCWARGRGSKEARLGWVVVMVGPGDSSSAIRRIHRHTSWDRRRVQVRIPGEGDWAKKCLILV